MSNELNLFDFDIIWVALIYLSVAFINTDLNAFNWSKEARSSIPIVSLIYFVFLPIFLI